MTTPKGRISDAFIQEVLSRTDIVQVIGDRIDLKSSGHQHMALCPFHHEKTPSFSVTPSKQFYHCFGCHASGDSLKFICEFEGWPFLKGLEYLAQLAGLELPKTTHESNEATQKNQALFRALEVAQSFFQAQWREPHAQEAIEYLKGRGLTGQIAKTFGLGFAPEGWRHLWAYMNQQGIREADGIQAGLVIQKDTGRCFDRFRGRVMFPIRDPRGRILGFGGRALGTQMPKYLNSPQTPLFHKGQCLYGIYENGFYGKLNQVVVTEGYLDVIALNQHNIKGAVATLGTAVTQAHLQHIFSKTDDVYFCFDGDAPGRLAAQKALVQAWPLLEDGRQIFFCFLPQGDDPDSYIRAHGAQSFKALLGQSVPLSEFFFQVHTQQCDMRSIDGRAKLAKTLKPWLQKLPKSVFKEMMWERYARVLRPEKHRFFSKTTAPEPPKTKLSVPLPLAMVIGLLAHQPSLRDEFKVPLNQVMDMNLNGGALLKDVLDVICRDPTQAFEDIQAQLQDTPLWKKFIAPIESRLQLVPKAGISQEFLGAISRLLDIGREKAAENLLNEAKRRELSPQEIKSLKKMIEGGNLNESQ